jgi:hypothetical protein
MNLAGVSFQNTLTKKKSMTPKPILVKPREQFSHRKRFRGSRFSGVAGGWAEP